MTWATGDRESPRDPNYQNVIKEKTECPFASTTTSRRSTLTVS
jgi:hypothetical protein